MSFKGKTSRKGSDRQSSKRPRERKPREKKTHDVPKYLREETPETSVKETTEKVLGALDRLGNQVFALSPFSQYFDDWLKNLSQVVSEFEAIQTIKIDEQFQKERTQAFFDVESALAENRLAESTLTQEAKALAENNHLIVETDKEYAERNRELSDKRNGELRMLSNKVHQIEDEIAVLQNAKFKFYQVGDKRRSREKLDEAQKNLIAANNELEMTAQNFSIEQEKMHDNYEKRKQELSVISDQLHKQLEKLETDISVVTRQKACNQLIQAIKEVISRSPLQP